MTVNRDQNIFKYLSAILALVFVLYLPALFNGFTYWDEIKYILDNPYVQDGFNIANIKSVFTHIFPVGYHYHPITILSWAAEKEVFGISPAILIWHNLLLHLINTTLVFVIISKITRHIYIAGFVSVAFGVHPMHVESVAWIVERKDVLMSMFYLSSVLLYVRYVETLKKNNLIVSFIMFILACLSKPIALTLPVVLLGMDYLFKREGILRCIKEKIIFLVVSIVVVYIGINQTSIGHGVTDLYQFHERVIFGCYSFVQYLLKFIIPINLSAYYPYPNPGEIPWFMYASVLGVVGFLYILCRTKNNREVFFGLSFFAILIIPILSVFPTSHAIMADRYTYLPYIGLALGVSVYLRQFLESKSWNNDFRSSMRYLSIIVLLLMSFIAMQRISVWQNGVILWSDVINQYPKNDLAYLNRGTAFAQHRAFEQALEDYNQALEINPQYLPVYLNRAKVFEEIGLKDFAQKDRAFAQFLLENRH